MENKNKIDEHMRPVQEIISANATKPQIPKLKFQINKVNSNFPHGMNKGVFKNEN